jgi:uncharacterized protein (DUF302 family)
MKNAGSLLIRLAVAGLAGVTMTASAMSSTAQPPGVVQLASRHTVAATLDRLQALLTARGILIFARIDFSADAQRAGLPMRPEELLIFGNPKAGTPLMQEAPVAGLDLPLKVLAWEAADGQVWLAYNDPQYLLRRYGLPVALEPNLTAALPLIHSAADP